VVAFTSDHGELLGDHQLLLKGGLHYRSLTRVAAIWRDPEAAPRRVDALAQTIDFAPTILDRAGVPPPNGMQGASLLPLVRGAAPVLREALLIEEEGQRRDFGWARRVRMRSLVDARYRLTLYDGTACSELYDRADDPLEAVNRWDDTAYGTVRAALTERLARAMLGATDESPYPTASA
jgi:arylsulfatase A-like enzyme